MHSKIRKIYQKTKLLNRAVTNISHYEKGVKRLTTEILAKLAIALNVTANNLLGGSVIDFKLVLS
jgi:hypothetical protein